ncbi:MAG: discoidin domain-containing protein [Thermoleophilia bacterium]
MDDQRPSSVVCRVCGVENPSGKLFCSGCGSYLQGEDEDTWVDLPLQQPVEAPQGAPRGADEPKPSFSGTQRPVRRAAELRWEAADPIQDPQRVDPAYGARLATSGSRTERRPPKKRRHWLLALFLVVLLLAALGLTATIAYRALIAPKDNRAVDGGGVTTRTTDAGGGATSTQPTAATQTTTTLGSPPGRKLEVASSMGSSTLPAEGGNTYGASNATDGDLSTCWSEGVDGQGTGEWIRLALDRPVVLATIGIANGYQKDGRRFYGNPRVARLLIEYSTGSSQTVQLYDSTGFQIVTPLSDTTQWVRFTIESTYPGESWQDTSISEIRLYQDQ